MSVPVGMLQIPSLWGEFNNVSFAIRQALSKVQTAMLVQVKSCTNDGGVTAVGFVDVLILVNQQNSSGVGLEEGQLVNLPYMRMQGGANAVILDPQPGDIGIAVFASRDISTVIATKKQSNPATFRTYDFSDGLYVGGVLNGVPTQYVQFTASGMTLVSPNQITLQAPTVAVDGDLTVSGTTTGTGDGTFAGIDVQTHVHGGVQSGGSDTGPPV
jgi:GpV Apex motif